MNIVPYITRILEHTQDFSYEELEAICQERIDQMGSKTKESSKLPILLKYLSSIFEIEFDDATTTKNNRFKSITKRLLQ